MHSRLFPLKGDRLTVMRRDKLIDRLPHLFRRSEASAPQGFPAQNAEPTLDLVQPRGISGSVMEMGSGMLLEPAILFGFMRIEIIHDHMNLLLGVQRHSQARSSQAIVVKTLTAPSWH